MYNSCLWNFVSLINTDLNYEKLLFHDKESVYYLTFVEKIILKTHDITQFLVTKVISETVFIYFLM